MALSPKQRRFVDEYLVDRNATNAAKRAGYSADTAYSQGSRLLKHVEVAAIIKKAEAFEKAKVVKRARLAGLTKERWLAELRSIALANIDDVATVKTEEWSGKKGRISSVQSVVVKDTEDRPRTIGRAIKKITPTKHGVSVEMHSKSSALQDLGKHYGWLKNEVELNLPESGVKVEITLPSNGREAVAPKADDDDDQT